MHRLQAMNPQFGEGDFRQYNPSGYDELLASLAAARQRAEAAATIVEKKLAQAHLDSVEQLWRLSVDLASERFNRARDAAHEAIHAAGQALRRSGPPIGREELHAMMKAAVAAYQEKDFPGAVALARNVSREAAKPAALQLVPAVRLATGADVVTLIEQALEHERNHRMGQAYRLYLQVLERQPANHGARQRLRALRGNSRGRV